MNGQGGGGCNGSMVAPPVKKDVRKPGSNTYVPLTHTNTGMVPLPSGGVRGCVLPAGQPLPTVLGRPLPAAETAGLAAAGSCGGVKDQRMIDEMMDGTTQNQCILIEVCLCLS